MYPYRAPDAVKCPNFREMSLGRLLPMLESWQFGAAPVAPGGPGVSVHPSAMRLIDGLLTVDPARRLGVEQACRSEWLHEDAPMEDGGAGGAPTVAQTSSATEAV